MVTNDEERARDFLESCVCRYKIFIDTCSLLHKSANQFFSHILPILKRENKKIIIPFKVYEEVRGFAENREKCLKKNDTNLHARAKFALDNIVRLQHDGIVEVYGNKDDTFPDHVFKTVFTCYQLKYDLMLVTQDGDLAREILEIGNSKAVKSSKRIRVARVNSYGFLSLIRSNNQQTSMNQIPMEERFDFTTSIRHVEGKLTVSSVPGSGDTLTAVRGERRDSIVLADAAASGGEGTIYTTSVQGVVAKIYKPEKIDCAKFEKLKLMMTKDIKCDGVCFPLALLYNQGGEFVGYLMKQAAGKELQRSLFIPQLLKKNFPAWTKIDTVNLCVTILEKLKYLHARNIILGDINPNNILVVSPKEVYFVDTDSYQIEGFPCPVGTINYTAPEIQRKDFSTFLRTMGNEYFAVSTLLFMIMLPGKPPYSLQGGENQVDNIINGDFAYASGERSTGKAPDGLWRFCWSHLPRYLKDDFYETFRKGGKHSTENSRYSTDDWLVKFKYYLELLVTGKLGQQDSMSLQIFPTRYKKNIHAKYIRCKICNEEVDEERTKNYICLNCLKGSVYLTCNCTQCGVTFEITVGEKEYFEKNNLQLPKRCPSCRKQKPPSHSGGHIPSHYDTSSSPSGGSGGGGGFCFITTAACEYFCKPDNCYELTLLREFRDTWLVLQPGGEDAVMEYYRIAPLIVRALDASKQRDIIYMHIWSRYIVPCVHMIEQRSYNACRVLYEKMILELEHTLKIGGITNE